MTVAQTVKRYTPEEYYRLEHEAEYKSEYYRGEIFAMAGARTRHNRIVGNLIREVGTRLKGKPCEILPSDQRLKVQATGLRTYPDASVYCGKIQYDFEDPFKDTALNPTVLFEVLSKSTQNYDRGVKAENYRQIETLRCYVVVAQVEPYVEVHEPLADGGWAMHEIRSLEGAVRIAAIGVELPMREIYDRVEFGAEEAEGA
jgi:Uma2 family endonuclease